MARRGSYAKGVAKREEILTAALEVVAREGCRGTSVKEIAAAAGLSQAGLMHHFASKDELFTEILRLRDEVDTALAASSPEAGILEIFPQVVRHNAEVPGLVQLYVSFSAEATAPGHFARDFFTERFERFRREIAAEIRQGQESGEMMASVHPDSAARALLALADGLQTQWLLDPDFDMAAHIVEAIDAWRSNA
ncbi:TetR/AcrR family transcriptional regulator [Paeniglutamicibacter sp. R2-26]|uniref:TetR/AcrR family transcriptional regulator n=1 Tax=Paeniglutamicibacter sp. R2-26 TaxID=3144417 RepID=UPI003EE4D919